MDRGRPHRDGYGDDSPAPAASRADALANHRHGDDARRVDRARRFAAECRVAVGLRQRGRAKCAHTGATAPWRRSARVPVFTHRHRVVQTWCRNASVAGPRGLRHRRHDPASPRHSGDVGCLWRPARERGPRWKRVPDCPRARADGGALARAPRDEIRALRRGRGDPRPRAVGRLAGQFGHRPRPQLSARRGPQPGSRRSWRRA